MVDSDGDAITMRLIDVAGGTHHVRIVAAILLIGACARTASAQPSPEDVLLTRAHKKMTAGIVLLCAGAVTLPITASDTQWSGPAKIVGLPLIGTGAALVLWGLRDREKATGRRRTTVTATVGNTRAIQITSQW
jgi:hypothetical protein